MPFTSLTCNPRFYTWQKYMANTSPSIFKVLLKIVLNFSHSTQSLYLYDVMLYMLCSLDLHIVPKPAAIHGSDNFLDHPEGQHAQCEDCNVLQTKTKKIKIISCIVDRMSPYLFFYRDSLAWERVRVIKQQTITWNIWNVTLCIFPNNMLYVYWQLAAMRTSAIKYITLLWYGFTKDELRSS